MWTTALVVATCVGLAYQACPEKCICNTKEHFVDCSNAGLNTIPWDLPDPIGLERLDLTGNNIRELISEIASYRNLKFLDLSNNGMLSIDARIFVSLINLQTLNLKDNELENLDDKTFEGMTALKVLDLSKNEIETIQGTPFSDLANLEDLNLSDNSIETISDTACVGLTKLRSLSLHSNGLQSIPTSCFQHLDNIHSLVMSDNAIETIPSRSLSPLKSLKLLDLSNNRVTEVSDLAFEDASNIQIMTLRNNKLERIPSEAITKLVELRSVDLSENPVSVVDPDAFKGLEKLKEIMMESMPLLEVIRSYAFGELLSLHAVHLHTNPKLRSIEKEAFLGSANIRHMDLHSNVLEALDATLFEWEHLDFLDLRYNSWNCDCHLNFLPSVLQLVYNQSVSGQVVCARPKSLESKPIMKLESDQFQCDVEMKKLEERHFEDRIMIGIIAGTSCLLLVIMIVLMVRSRHTMCGATGPIPVTYRVRRSSGNMRCNGHVARRGAGDVEADQESDDRMAIAENEEQPHGRENVQL